MLMRRSQQPQEWQGVPALIDRLIETAEVGHRDRILLEAVACRPWVRACALWRPGSDGPEFGARWHQVLARGPEDALPEREAIHSVVRGERDGDFYAGVRVWLAGAGRGAFALAAAGCAAPEDEEEWLESLLCLFAVIEESDGAEREVEPWMPILPADESSRMEHELRNLMTGIQATQELLAVYGDELSEEERDRFAALLDEECTRAGDLLGRTLGPRAGRQANGTARPHALLTVLAREFEAEGGTTIRLRARGAATELECSVDGEELGGLLRAWLKDLCSDCAGVELSLEAGRDLAAPLLLHATRLGAALPAMPDDEHVEAFARLGLQLAREGAAGCLRIPVRRSA